MPSSLHRSDQTEEVNWAPRSVVMVEGTPKREIQWRMKAEKTERAEVSASGIASGQRVLRSTRVRTEVTPPLDFRGPTRSRWTWENLRTGTGISSTGAR